MGRIGQKVKKIGSMGLKVGVGLAAGMGALALGSKSGGGHDAFYESPTPQHEEVAIDVAPDLGPVAPMGGGEVDVFSGGDWGGGGGAFGSSGFGEFGGGSFG